MKFKEKTWEHSSLCLGKPQGYYCFGEPQKYYLVATKNMQKAIEKVKLKIGLVSLTKAYIPADMWECTIRSEVILWVFGPDSMQFA